MACLVRLASAAEADDAAQDVFVKAFQSLAHFRSESSFETWILRIADNHCLDLLKARTRRRAESLEQLLEQDGPALEALMVRAESEEDPPLLPDERALLS